MPPPIATQEEAAARDDRIAHLAHAGRDGYGQIAVGVAHVFFRQYADGDSPRIVRAARSRFHHAAPPAADDRHAGASERIGHLLRRGAFCFAAVTRAR